MDVILVLIGYLVGTIPFALLLARRMRGTDVRYVGSGNIGAANVLRTSGVSIGVMVMALDVSKGYAAALFAQRMGATDALQAVVGAAAVVGHVFPVWLRFRGGKGVATACGVFAALAPEATAGAAGVFVLVVWLTRYVSVGSMAASLALPGLAYLTGASAPIVTAAIGVAALVLIRHRANVVRLQAGRERRLGHRT